MRVVFWSLWLVNAVLHVFDLSRVGEVRAALVVSRYSCGGDGNGLRADL